MKRQRNTIHMKEQARNTEVQINKEEIGKLPEKEFRILIVKMIEILENTNSQSNLEKEEQNWRNQPA